jgi:hypothetical protein
MTVAVGALVRPAALAPVVVWAYPLALVLLLTDLALLVLDLGNPLRFHHMLRVFKPSSPMSLGTWCLTLYSLPLAVLVVLDVLAQLGAIPGDSSVLSMLRTVLLVVALPFCFGSMAYKGVLFSTSAQPGWKDARWFGAYHVGSAFALGAALALGLASLVGSDPAVHLLRSAAGILLVVQLIPLGLLGAELWPALTARFSRGHLRGTAALALGVGVVVPLALLPVGGVALVVGACGALAGGWVVRHLLVRLPSLDKS